MIELAPSILSADFAHLADQVARAAEGGAAVIHVDIMDGHFVPNLTIGPPVVKSLRKVTQLPLDCHLMIENPDEFIPIFAEAGADWISVHQEACVHLNRTLQHIRDHGARPGVVLNPATPVDTLTEVLDMAAAAAAESAPAVAPGPAPTDPRAIASIVDSVLAELRPKIVEEIAKKLAGDAKKE